MKTIFKIIFLPFVLLTSSPAFSQWYEISPGSAYRILDFSFINKDTGYIVADKGYSSPTELLRTDNGGMLWYKESRLNVNNPGYVKCVGKNMIYVAGFKVYKSVNGGITWDSSSANCFFPNMRCFDSICYGSGLGIYRSADLGSTWSLIGDSCAKFYFIDKNTGWYLRESEQTINYQKKYTERILTTSNGGQIWQTLSTPLVNQVSSERTINQNIVFVNKDTGYWTNGSISNDTLYRTTDGGIQWKVWSVLGTNMGPLNIAVISSRVFFFGEHTIRKTTDAGLTNSVQYYNSSSGTPGWWYNKIQVIDSSVCFALQDNASALLRTINQGGSPFTGINEETSSSTFIISPNPANSIVLFTFKEVSEGPVHLTIVDVKGHIMINEAAEANAKGIYEKVIDVAGFPKGIYIVQVQQKNHLHHEKMLVY